MNNNNHKIKTNLIYNIKNAIIAIVPEIYLYIFYYVFHCSKINIYLFAYNTKKSNKLFLLNIKYTIIINFIGTSLHRNLIYYIIILSES